MINNSAPWIVEYFFKAGSFAGLISAGVLIFDRFFKHRPSIHLHRVLMHHAPDVMLKVINNDNSDLVIHRLECSSPNWAMAGDDETKTIIRAAINKSLSDFVIEPNGSHMFHLIRVKNTDSEIMSEAIKFTITWDLTGRPWFWRRETVLRAHTDQIRQLLRADPVY